MGRDSSHEIPVTFKPTPRRRARGASRRGTGVVDHRPISCWSTTTTCRRVQQLSSCFLLSFLRRVCEEHGTGRLDGEVDRWIDDTDVRSIVGCWLRVIVALSRFLSSRTVGQSVTWSWSWSSSSSSSWSWSWSWSWSSSSVVVVVVVVVVRAKCWMDARVGYQLFFCRAPRARERGSRSSAA